MKISAAVLSLGLVVLGAPGVQADTVKPVDLSKLRSTNVYVLMPQSQVFIEANAANVNVNVLGPNPLLLVPSAMISTLLVNAIGKSQALQDAQQYSYPFHYMVDGYDVGATLRDGALTSLKPLPWLHPVKETALDDDSTNHIRMPSMNGDGDSMLAVQLYYSMTPDYTAVVTIASVGLYSSALSPDKYSPYDPDSKFAWLKQPVATRACIYQSRLVSIPSKTPDVIAQLKALADKEFDADKLKREAAGLDPYNTPLNVRSDVESRMRRYNELIKEIGKPAWGVLDSRLMMGMLWAANDGALYKQAISDGAAAIGGLIDASLQPMPMGLEVTLKDQDGKPMLYKLSDAGGRTVLESTQGGVVSFETGDTLRIGNLITP